MPTQPTPEAAAALARRGLALFPLPPGGRRPLARGWLAAATADAEQLRATWRTGDNIGVACRASHVVGLDLDHHGGGVEQFGALLAARGLDWPDTLTVATPSGGRHLYFRAPDGCTLGSTSGGTTRLGPGIDTRGPGLRSGGYLIGPGSVVDDTAYAITHDAPVRELPHWIADLLAPRTPGKDNALTGRSVGK